MVRITRNISSRRFLFVVMFGQTWIWFGPIRIVIGNSKTDAAIYIGD